MDKDNIGLATLNGDAASLSHKTIIVLGMGRGGTSMVAGTLAKLGIYMGEQLSSRYQDNVLLDCLNRKDKKKAKEIIRQRNEKYAVWGVKKLQLWRWDNLFREPVYVVVFRDIFATANRRISIFDMSLLSAMFKILGLNFLLLIFLRLSKRPVLMVSYEKALLYPENFVASLASFIGLVDSAKFSEAAQFIKPSPAAYTDWIANYRAIRENRDYLGYIDAIEADKVIGWALSTLNTESLEIELLINNVSKQKVVANLSRADVASENPRFHENCGFVFELSIENQLKTGDEIEVRIVKEKINLINSPQQFA